MNDQKRAFLAIFLSGLILFAWQYFYGPNTAPGQGVTNSQNISESQPILEKSDINSKELKIEKKSSFESLNSQVKPFVLSNSRVSFHFASNLCLIDASNKNTSLLAREVFLEGNFLCFDFSFLKPYSNLSVEVISESKVIVNSPNKGSVIFELAENSDLLDLKFISESSFSGFFSLLSHKNQLENGKISSFVYYTDSLNSIGVGDEEVGDAALRWFGIDFNYHLLSVIMSEATPFIFNSSSDNNFKVKIPSEHSEFNVKLLFAKKEYDYLLSQKNLLHHSVDFGIWSVIAVPILRGLQFFYTIFPNWGIAIVLLTLLIRLITFPLQYKSIKSMKKLQIIQPQLTEIREKYKEDPKLMQQETMKLFKTAGANPLGGCLPLLLQMPIFFAFYQVLYTAVELVGAPFYGWIFDLSEKDPYYVLPVLMALAMFIHQKLTPTATADPVQKKVLLFMPLIFGFFMKDLPSGLTLYILVSTVFALFQQVLVFKNVK